MKENEAIKQSENTGIQQDKFLEPKSQKDFKQLVKKIHSIYYQKISFQEVDYFVGQPQQTTVLNETPHPQFKSIVAMVDNCLLFTEKAYDMLYNYLLKNVQNQKVQWTYRNICADLLVTLNGENDKVYNLKKSTIIKMRKQKEIGNGQEKLDIERQLDLNAAIIMKNKKSSSCYEYRFWLIQFLLQQKNQNQSAAFNNFLTNFQNKQHILLKRIFERFPRNYFCWMYRLRMYKLITKYQNTKQINLTQVSLIYELLQKYPNDYSVLNYYRFLLRYCHQKDYEKQIIISIKEKNQKLLEFCKVVYESEEHYKHLLKFIEEVGAKFTEIGQKNK